MFKKMMSNVFLKEIGGAEIGFYEMKVVPNRLTLSVDIRNSGGLGHDSNSFEFFRIPPASMNFRFCIIILPIVRFDGVFLKVGGICISSLVITHQMHGYMPREEKIVFCFN